MGCSFGDGGRRADCTGGASLPADHPGVRSTGVSRVAGRRAARTRPVRVPVPGAQESAPRPGLLTSPLMADLKVAIADDSALMREGVARVLGDAGFQVVAQVANAVELMAAITTHSPDVVVVDIR